MNDHETDTKIISEETTSINITGLPVSLRAEIRRLAAEETRGIDSKIGVVLLREAIESRRRAKEMNANSASSNERDKK